MPEDGTAVGTYNAEAGDERPAVAAGWQPFLPRWTYDVTGVITETAETYLTVPRSGDWYLAFGFEIASSTISLNVTVGLFDYDTDEVYLESSPVHVPQDVGTFLGSDTPTILPVPLKQGSTTLNITPMFMLTDIDGFGDYEFLGGNLQIYHYNIITQLASNPPRVPLKLNIGPLCERKIRLGY